MAMMSLGYGSKEEHEADGMRVEVSSSSFVSGVMFKLRWRVRIRVRVEPRRSWTSLWLQRDGSRYVQNLTLEARFIQAGPGFSDVILSETWNDCATLELTHWMPDVRDFYPQLPFWRRLGKSWPAPCLVEYAVTIVDELTRRTLHGRLTVPLPDMNPN
jgi:hypothetical protein